MFIKTEQEKHRFSAGTNVNTMKVKKCHGLGLFGVGRDVLMQSGIEAVFC